MIQHWKHPQLHSDTLLNLSKEHRSILASRKNWSWWIPESANHSKNNNERRQRTDRFLGMKIDSSDGSFVTWQLQPSQPQFHSQRSKNASLCTVSTHSQPPKYKPSYPRHQQPLLALHRLYSMHLSKAYSRNQQEHPAKTCVSSSEKVKTAERRE